MSQAKTELLAQQFASSTEANLKQARGIAEEIRFAQAKEGKGHPLWQMGHIAQALDLMISQWALGGDAVMPAELNPKFSPDIMGGLPITANPDDYPSWDEVLGYYETSAAKVVELVGALNDEDLEGGMQGSMPDNLREYFGNLGSFLNLMLLHDGHHHGQISLIAGLHK